MTPCSLYARSIAAKVASSSGWDRSTPRISAPTGARVGMISSGMNRPPRVVRGCSRQDCGHRCSLCQASPDDPTNRAGSATQRTKECHTVRSWIHHTQGRHVRQARVGLGDLREEHISRQGFFGPVAMIYREHGPNEVIRVEGTLVPRRVADTTRVEPSDMADPRGMPEVMLSNVDVSVAISRRTAPMPYAYRNTDGDLLYFVHKGTGRFATEFGRLVYEPGDYVLIPKGITFSVLPDPGDSHMLVVESPSPLSLTEHKQVGRHMPVDPTVLVLPELHDFGWPQRDEYELRVKHGGAH